MECISIIIVISYIVILLFVWLFLNHKNKHANNSVIVTLGLSFLDVITDILSVVELYSYGSMLYIVSMGCIILPAMINHCIAWGLMYFLLKENPPIILPKTTMYGGREIKMADMNLSTSNAKDCSPPQFITTKEWMDQNYILCSLIVMASTLNVENMTILSSRMLGNTTLKIKWPLNYEYRIRLFGIISNFLEDIPQLCIQLYFMITIDSTSMILLISIISSAIALSFSLIKRTLLYMLEHVDSNNLSKMESTEQEFENNATRL